MTRLTFAVAAFACVVSAPGAMAQQGQGMGGMGHGQPGMGPVALSCNDDMAKLCEGKEHGGRAIRTCLEQNIGKVSDACKAALASTGPGRRP